MRERVHKTNKTKKKVREWTAWMVNQRECEMDDHPLFYFTNPGVLSDDWVVVKVKITEVVGRRKESR